MEITKLKWQQCGTHKNFVYALNDKGFNDFCFIVQCANNAVQERAIATLACAAPELLDALIFARTVWGSYAMQGDKDTDTAFAMMDAAIKQAKGEV